jgi:hypothetical protein
MDSTTAEIDSPAAKASNSPEEQLHQQLQQLHQNLRTVRHGINNNVAVLMAMAELTQRNPAQCAKLAQLCLEKAPAISASIGGFSELFDSALSLAAELEVAASKR